MKAVLTSFLTLCAASGVLSASVGYDPLQKRGMRVVKRENGRQAKIYVVETVMNSAAYETTLNSEVLSLSTLQTRSEPEPDPSRPDVEPDLIFVLMCTEPGLRGNCTNFGAPPGYCADFQHYDPFNTTYYSSVFDNNVTSLSVNTGTHCQFYKYLGCDDKGDDRGLTSAYNYNLAVPLPSDPRTVEYENEISSWKC